MQNHKEYTELIKWHNGIDSFNYDLAIDWAIEWIRQGIETENILIIASFSKPVVRHEIKPYISSALKELNLEEKYGDYSNIANIHFYLDRITNKVNLRQNLTKLKDICLDLDHKYELTTFYLLYHGWRELEEIGANYYYDGANLENIEEIIVDQARKWIEKYVNKNQSVEIFSGRMNSEDTNKTFKNKDRGIWNWIKNLFE